MLGNNQPKVFSGVRFLLLGFDPLTKANVLKKLIDGGAVDAGHFGPNCTHVIVHQLPYDDPQCVAARSNGKPVVTGLWVDHSFDVGMPLDISSIMYRPLRDINGIPGAESLVICLTGYQHQDREDIMTMVGLMGANFSKPLVAHKVTHLVCYKFEGQKYELAKKMKRIKLVNHHWLEDCLEAWEILAEANYDKSGYELELMEAEAKDSEEEGEGVNVKQHAGISASIQHPLMLKKEISGEPLDFCAPKGSGPFDNTKDSSAVMEKSTSAQIINPLEMQNNHSDMVGSHENGEPSNQYNTTSMNATSENVLASTSKERTPTSGSSKLCTASYSRKIPKRTTPPSLHSREDAGKLNSSIKRDKLKLNRDLELSSSTRPQEDVKNGVECFKTPVKGSLIGSEAKQPGTLSEKRKTEVLSGTSKLQKVGGNTKELPEHPVLANAIEGVAMDLSGCEPVDRSDPPQMFKSNKTAALNPVRNSFPISATKSSNCTSKLVKRTSPFSKTSASETMQEERVDAVQSYSKGLKRAPLSSELECRDVSMSTPQPTTVEDQEQVIEAQDNPIRTPCTEKFASRKSNTNTESGGVAVGRRENIAVDDHELHNVMQDILTPNTRRSDIRVSPRSGILEQQTSGALESDSKSLGRKMVGKKLLGSKRSIGKEKSANQKGSIFLKKTAPINDSLTCSAAVEEMEHLEKSAITEVEMMMEKADGHSEKLAGSKSLSADDETEPPEDKEVPDQENCEEVEEANVVSKIVNDEEQLEGRTEEISAARGKKRELKESIHTGDQVTAKITKRKKRSLDQFKKTSASSVLHVSNVKAVPADDVETESPEQKEAVGEGKYEEAEPDNATGSNANEEGKKKDLRESSKSNTENPVKEKKRSLGKSKSNSIPSALCETTEQGVGKDGSSSENKHKRKKIEKDTAPCSVGKTKKALAKNELKNTREMEKENQPIHIADENNHQSKISKKQKGKVACKVSKNNPEDGESVIDLLPKKHVSPTEPVWFILSGHRIQRKEFQQVIKRLKGRVCRDSHQWSYQATHFIVPDPIRRTEKFFAAAASGRWILRTDFLTASNQAGKFLLEEPYEWHKTGLSEDGAINLEAPRKWRLLKEKTGHGAFYGMRIVVYGDCIAPPLDTLKRAIKAGDGTILATSPPYTRFLKSGIDFAVISPGMPHVDVWVQEFLRHEIPCVVADYLVEYVCKPGYSLERHIQYNTHSWAEKSLNNLKNRLEEIVVEPSTPPCDNNDVPCEVCGLRDRGDLMLICGDESGSKGCGDGTHIDCCNPPLDDVPKEDWYCPKCSKTNNSSKTLPKNTKKKALGSKRK